MRIKWIINHCTHGDKYPIYYCGVPYDQSFKIWRWYSPITLLQVRVITGRLAGAYAPHECKRIFGTNKKKRFSNSRYDKFWAHRRRPVYLYSRQLDGLVVLRCNETVQTYVNRRYSRGQLQRTSVCGTHYNDIKFYMSGMTGSLCAEFSLIQRVRWERWHPIRAGITHMCFQHYCPHKFEIPPRFPPSETIQWPANNMLRTN